MSETKIKCCVFLHADKHNQNIVVEKISGIKTLPMNFVKTDMPLLEI